MLKVHSGSTIEALFTKALNKKNNSPLITVTVGKKKTPLLSFGGSSGAPHAFWQLLCLSWGSFPPSKRQHSSLFPATSSDEIPFILLKYLVRPLTGGLKGTCACYLKINAFDLEEETTLNKIQSPKRLLRKPCLHDWNSSWTPNVYMLLFVNDRDEL